VKLKDRQFEPREGQILNFQIFKPWKGKKNPNQNLNHRMPRELINEEQMEAMAQEYPQTLKPCPALLDIHNTI
jgi:hypothetical protein